eukprot:XP_001709029.1 Hypothetical protein GL50803_28461 [Giardia lamblia ATCC 50803]
MPYSGHLNLIGGSGNDKDREGRNQKEERQEDWVSDKYEDILDEKDLDLPRKERPPIVHPNLVQHTFVAEFYG